MAAAADPAPPEALDLHRRRPKRRPVKHCVGWRPGGGRAAAVQTACAAPAASPLTQGQPERLNLLVRGFRGLVEGPLRHIV